MTQEPIVRVYHARRAEVAEQAYREDVAHAVASGYRVVDEAWTLEADGYHLTVQYTFEGDGPDESGRADADTDAWAGAGSAESRAASPVAGPMAADALAVPEARVADDRWDLDDVRLEEPGREERERTSGGDDVAAGAETFESERTPETSIADEWTAADLAARYEDRGHDDLLDAEAQTIAGDERAATSDEVWADTDDATSTAEPAADAADDVMETLADRETTERDAWDELPAEGISRWTETDEFAVSETRGDELAAVDAVGATEDESATDEMFDATADELEAARPEPGYVTDEQALAVEPEEETVAAGGVAEVRSDADTWIAPAPDASPFEDTTAEPEPDGRSDDSLRAATAASEDEATDATLQPASAEASPFDDAGTEAAAADVGGGEVEAAAPAAGATRGRRRARLVLETLELHSAGEPLRLIRSGIPPVPFAPIMERRRWMEDNADHIRRVALNEPRGHRDMYGAILLPPYEQDADIAVLFMHNGGYSTMCGHGTIAIASALVEEGLFPGTAPETVIRFETPAGIVAAHVANEQFGQDFEVSEVRFTNVPSYLAAAGLRLRPDGLELADQAADEGLLRIDVGFGGAFYGIVDAADLGIRVMPENAEELRRAGTAITELLRRDYTPEHPVEPELDFIYGTIIVDHEPSTIPDGRAADADMRNVAIFGDGEIDRSPCGSGTSALLAQLYYYGAIDTGNDVRNAGITGEVYIGRVDGPAVLGPQEALVTSVAGTGYVTGYQTLVVDSRDPLGPGFLVR